jgi:hypothetical protein
MIQSVVKEHYFDVVDEFHDVMKRYYDVLLKNDIENLENEKNIFIYIFLLTDNDKRVCRSEGHV